MFLRGLRDDAKKGEKDNYERGIKMSQGKLGRGGLGVASH